MAIKLPLSILDYSRSVAGEPDIKLVNRLLEQDPTNTDNQVALLTRPALRKWLTIGDGPIRVVFSQPGTFGEALFSVSGDTVYKIATDETTTSIGTLATDTGYVSMDATETHLFIADGGSLNYYTENEYARGTLTASGAISAGDKVVVDAFTYQFATDVTPAADGSSGSPWLVLLGGTRTDSLTNLYNALGNTGTAGTDYSLGLSGNPTVRPSSVDATTLKIRAADAGTGGNSIATTETGANIAWGAATLAGGGGSAFAAVSVPDGVGIISVCVINGFTICVVAQGQGLNGRYYFIRPGEITIDGADFETAERSPDPVWNAVGLGDHFLLPGPSGTEDHYPTGEGDAPFQRQQGHLYDKGVWPGTVIKIKDSVLMIGGDAIGYNYAGEPEIITTPGTSQRIREAINAQRAG